MRVYSEAAGVGEPVHVDDRDSEPLSDIWGRDTGVCGGPGLASAEEQRQSTIEGSTSRSPMAAPQSAQVDEDGD